MSATAAESIPLEPATNRKAAAERIVITSTMLGAGAGAIPVPIWDLVAISGVQLKMLADLSALYGKHFTDDLGKSAIAALLGGIAPNFAAQGTIGLFAKTLPGLGSIVGAIALPTLAGATTYAVGQVFIRYYESNGELLGFDPKKFQAGFSDEVKAGMKKVAEFKI